MRRTNEEFRAEVFRRKEEYVKARNRRIVKSIVATLVCLPLFCVAAFMSIMIAIAMQPAGSAAPNSGADMSLVVRAEVRGEDEPESRALSEKTSAELAALFSEITNTSAQQDINRGENAAGEYEYSVVLYDRNGGRGYFYVAESYLSERGEYFRLTSEQYERFLKIISEGETQ